MHKFEKNGNYNKNHYDFIENFIELKFEKICGETFNLIQSKTSVDGEKESYSNYYSDIVAKTVFYSNNITSITFEGILNKKSAAQGGAPQRLYRNRRCATPSSGKNRKISHDQAKQLGHGWFFAYTGVNFLKPLDFLLKVC